MKDEDLNPYKGVSLWREFVYDMRHLGKMHRRATANIKELGMNWWLLLAIAVAMILYFVPELFISNPIIKKP
jgi:hypothetical protein